MSILLQIILTLCLAATSARALDFAATPQSVWMRHIGPTHPAVISEATLRDALEWNALGTTRPRLGATPYGVRMAQWDRSIANFSLPVVADEYVQFLHSLRAELEREQLTKARN